MMPALAPALAPLLPGLGVDFTVESYPTREAWRAAKRIGSGDAPSLWGYGFSSPLAIFEERRALRAERDVPEYVEIGELVEPVIATLYERRTGDRVSYPGPFVLLRSLRWPFMGASLDRVIDRLGAPVGLLEAKNRGRERWDDGVPLGVQIQMQHAMAVTGWTWGAGAVISFGSQFRWADVARDDPFIAAHVARCERLWRAIEDGEPPPIDDSEETAAALRRLYPKDDGRTVELPDECAGWAKTWAEAKEDADTAETAARWAESKLRRYIGEATAGRLPSGELLVLKTQKDGKRILRRKDGNS